MKSKQVKVQLDDRTVVVKKLPLGKYAELLKAIQDLPKHLSKFQNANSDDILAALPELVADGLPDVVRVIAIATPVTEEEAMNMGADEAIKLLIAVYEVNNYQEIFDSIKKVTAQTQSDTQS